MFGCYFKFGQTEKHFQLTENESQNNGKSFPFSFSLQMISGLGKLKRERERESKKIADVGARRSHRSKTIAPLRLFKPTLVEPSHRSSRSSRHFQTTRKERDKESREIVAPTNPLALMNPLASRTHSHREPTRTDSFSFSFEIFVIKFVCDFDFLLSLFDL